MGNKIVSRMGNSEITMTKDSIEIKMNDNKETKADKINNTLISRCVGGTSFFNCINGNTKRINNYS